MEGNRTREILIGAIAEILWKVIELERYLSGAIAEILWKVIELERYID